jgi:hypothetical protein
MWFYQERNGLDNSLTCQVLTEMDITTIERP